MMKDVFEQVCFHDLTPDLQLLAESFGIEIVRNLLRNFGGISFYIPKMSRLDGFIIKYIKENSGKSLKIIASELGVSEHFLRVLSKKKPN
ncbi:MAG: hypothetical protein HW421_1423 [Ignavibacteria bacterium]|nr:hypothetical protein [Ignavibacteria bacterium]